MEENKRHIDDFLRDELGDYTETPPPAVWDALEKRLDSPQNRKGFDFRKWWWFIPALLFIAGGTYLAAHKWSGKPAEPKPQPSVIDNTAPENTYAPANVYRDTAQNQPRVDQQPAAKPADSPLHNTPKTSPSVTDIKTAAQPAPNLNKDVQPANATQSNVTAQPAPKAKRQKNNKPAVAINDQAPTANKDVQPTNAAQSDVAAQPAPKAKKQKASKPAVATNNDQAPTVNKDVPSTNAAQSNVAAQPAPKAKKLKTSKPAVAINDQAKAVNKDISSTDAARPNEIATKPASNNKKQLTVAGKAAQPKRSYAVAPAVEKNKKPLPSETAPAAKPVKAKPAKQAPPAAAKANTPAVKKEVQPASSVSSTVTARIQKPQKQKPAAQDIAADKPQKPVNTPVQSSPVQEKTKDQSYTFQSKTNTNDKPKEETKAKSNLDLSDKQAEAEADTAADREMDPYASLNPPQDRKKPKLEGGIKAAYTYGFNDFALNKITALPYVQLNINTRLSVALHLGFSYGQMKQTSLAGPQSYYNITNTSLQTTPIVDSIGGSIDTFYFHNYSQTRDSFSVKYTTAKSLWEIELPVMLKYNLSSSLSLFGGPVFTFGKVIEITEDKSSTYSRSIKDTLTLQTQQNINYFNNRNQPSGLPDSAYSNAPYRNPTSTPVRIGYMLGLSYNAGPRMVVDLSVQQMISSPGFIPNETIRKVYTQPYVRLAVGFRIFK